MQYAHGGGLEHAAAASHRRRRVFHGRPGPHARKAPRAITHWRYRAAGCPADAANAAALPARW